MGKDLQHKGKQRVEEAGAPAGAVLTAAAVAAHEQAVVAAGGHRQRFWRNLGWLLVGAGAGALTTYLLDPDRGRRRQALLRDQVVHARKTVERTVPQKVRHVQNRLQGLGHDLAPAGADDGLPESPAYEIAHNDDGSLTAPGY